MWILEYKAVLEAGWGWSWVLSSSEKEVQALGEKFLLVYSRFHLAALSDWSES